MCGRGPIGVGGEGSKKEESAEDVCCDPGAFGRDGHSISNSSGVRRSGGADRIDPGVGEKPAPPQNKELQVLCIFYPAEIANMLPF